MNRLTYDACSYDASLRQSVAPISYVLDPIRYEHCNKCRPELGVVGGTAVSHVTGNLVDLENNLRGGDRPNTHCAQYKWLPQQGAYVQGKEYIKPVQHPAINTSMQHMNACQFTTYPSVPPTPPMDLYRCGK